MTQVRFVRHRRRWVAYTVNDYGAWGHVGVGLTKRAAERRLHLALDAFFDSSWGEQP